MKGQTNKWIRLNEVQRQLRNAPTNAEHKLWQHLKRRQLENCKFRRQHPFGNFILDFVCLERHVVIELDGGQHDRQRLEDVARTDILKQAGFVVMRFWNNEVLLDGDGVIEAIRQCLVARATPSPPNPPLEGEG